MLSDRLGTAHFRQRIKKIISIVPSWTEFVCDLGRREDLIARTDFCVHPEAVKSLQTVGGTKNPDIATIINLAPDVVIANKEENKQSDINLLRAEGISVFNTAAISVEDAIEEMVMIEFLLTGHTKATVKFQQTVPRASFKHYTFLYLVWKDPVMCAGPMTYISNVIQHSGGKNIVHEQDARYPKLDLTRLEILPDYIFLPDEPYEFSRDDVQILAEKFPSTTFKLVDGKLASWYGFRLSSAISYYSGFE